ncbi:MAG: Wzz/FepE/Etk N-terminal domain-containing protein [Patescibacteria group bacterium]|jgi:capsular polysaccharide biosynthesis protein
MDINLVKRKKWTIVTLVLLFLIFGLGGSLVQGFKYEASAKILVYQKFPAGTDIYSINRSNEYLSSVLAEVVKSDSFYGEVMQAGFNIDADYFNEEKSSKDILKKWGQTAEARPAIDSGMINISVFHPDRSEAEKIARAVNFVLVTKNQNYHGGGENVVIKIIDKPLVSDWPVKPNLPLNLGLAFTIGLVVAFTYIYLFPEEGYDLSFLPRRKTNRIKNYENIPDHPGREENNWHSFASVLAAKKEGQNYPRESESFSAPSRGEVSDLSGDDEYNIQVGRTNRGVAYENPILPRDTENEYTEDSKNSGDQYGASPAVGFKNEESRGETRPRYEDILSRGSMENLR